MSSISGNVFAQGGDFKGMVFMKRRDSAVFNARGKAFDRRTLQQSHHLLGFVGGGKINVGKRLVFKQMPHRTAHNEARLLLLIEKLHDGGDRMMGQRNV